uniref:Uncharacterized protein n=1 Tax=Anguilla anguilla TaxID=7936 RepID=A0A0E9UQN2_ANGAN
MQLKAIVFYFDARCQNFQDKLVW